MHIYIRLLATAFLFFLSPTIWGQYSGTGTFTKITALSDLTDGYYVVAYGTTQAMNNTYTSSTYFANTAISPVSNVLTNPNAAIVWKIETNGAGRTIYNEGIASYVSFTGASNNVQSVAAVSGNNQRWTFAYTGGLFTVANVAVSTRFLEYNTGSPRFACYTGSQQDLTLYKMASPTPVITLSNNGTQVTAANVLQGTSNQIISTFKLDVATAAATLTSAYFATSGTYQAADINGSGFKLWYNPTNAFGTATQIGTSQSSTSTGSGDIIGFTSLSQSIATGTTGYFWVTASIAAGATVGRTISLDAIANADFTFSAGTKSGSATAGGSQTIIAPSTPTLNATALTAFGNQCVNNTYGPNSFTINGTALTTANITVSSLSGFQFSTTSGGTYTNSLSLTQAGGTYSQMIYVKFNPTAAVSYNGNIVIGGGGATSINVAATGTGINTAPSVTTVTASVIGTTSASSGGNAITSACGTITAKGVVWGLSANPSIPSVNSTNDGTGTASYTSSLTGLTSNTTYNYRAYVTNSNGVTSYGTNLTFATLKDEPTNNPVGFACGATLTTSIPLSWADATGGTLPDGYLIKWGSSYAAITDPTDGSTINGANSITVNQGVGAVSVTGLAANTAYFFKIYPYSNSGSDINYKTVSPLQTTCTTLSGPCLEESFTTTTFPPTDWVQTNVTRSTTAADYNTSPAAASFGSNTGTLTTPVLANPSSVSFYLGRSTNATAKTLNVNVSTTNQTTGFTTVATYDHSNVASGSYDQYTVDLSAYSSYSTVWIQFEKNSSTTSPWRFDDVQISCAPACTQPTTQAVLTSINTSTPSSLTLNFTRGNGDGAIVVAKSASAATDLSSGTAYILGDAVGGGNVVYKGTASGINTATTQTIGSLNPETQYFFNLYEYTASSNCYKTPKAAGSAWTLSTEPPAHAAAFSCTSTSYNQIDLSFSAASTLTNADGYIILQKTGSVPTGVPVDGNAYVIGNSIGDATVAAIVNSTSAVSQSIMSLSGSTNYYFTLVPFNWNLSNAPTYNYRTAATIPSSNCTTPAAPSIASDIVDAADVAVYTSNINYLTWQSAIITNTSNSVGVFKFNLRDGGATMSDTDVLPTILTAINFNYVGTANTIRSAALFSGNTFVASGTVSANGISFSGLSGANVTANDNGSQTLTLRVTFTSTVTDNDKLVFSVASATAGSSSTSSQFTTISAQSDNITSNDRNRIEVTADRLVFVQQPSTTPINMAMTPSVTISANDINGNKDLDFISSINVTSTGTLTGSPVSSTAVNGVATFGSLTHTVAGIGLVLNGASTGLTATGNSNTFDITTVSAGSYRTTSAGTWPTTAAGNATWERFTSGAWASAAKPAANTTDMLYIRHTVTSNAAFAATAPGTYMVVENGGTFNDGHNSTFASLTVQSGGVFGVNSPGASIHSTGTVTAESGGRVILNSATLDNTDGFWDGTENFKKGSTVEIQNWDWDNSGSNAYRLVNNPSQISLNSDGYLFGNLYFNASPTENFTFIASIPASGISLPLTQNDLQINNGATFAVQLVNTDQDVLVAGNLIVDGGDFRAAAVTSVEVAHTVKGNLVMNGGTINLNPTSSTTNGCVVNLEGDMILNVGTFSSTDLTGCGLNFSGTTLQNIDAKNTVTLTAIKMQVLNNASVQIINQNFLIGNNCDLTVKTGGMLNFNFSSSNVALILAEITAANVTSFTQEANATIKITSPVGITSTGLTGNVQTDTRTFDGGGIYHYIGKANQVTGNGLPVAASAKKVIVEMDNNTLTLAAVATTRFNASGTLEIRKGIVTDNGTSFFADGTVAGEAGNLTMTGGLYQFNDIVGTSTSTTYYPRLSGTYTLTGGVIELASNTAASQYQRLRGGKTYYKLRVSGTSSAGGYKDISSAIVIKSNLEIKDDAIFDTKSNGVTGDAGLTMTGGRWKISKLSNAQPELKGDSTVYSLTGGTFELYGTMASNNQSIRTRFGSNQPIIYNNIDINADAANIGDYNTTIASLTLNVAGIMNINSPAVFQIDAANFVAGTGAFNVNAGSTLKYANASGITLAPSSTGAITTTTRSFPSTASYGFVGSVNQNVGSGLPSEMVNMYVQKTTAMNTVTLAGNTKVNTTLSMTLGDVITGANMLELGISDAQLGTLVYTAGRVVGTMKRWFNGTNSGIASGLFPLGVSGNDRFTTVEYTSAPSAGGSLTNHFVPTYMGINGLPLTITTGACLPLSIINTSEDGYWQIDAAGLAGGNYDITLVGQGLSGITSLCELSAIKRVGTGPWVQSGVHLTPTGTISRPVVKREGASGWSNWGFGGGSVNPLPVKMISFDGKCLDNTVSLKWTTASEINSERFIVEGSADLQLFEYITEVPAAGNSNELRNYDVSVLRASQVSYFRLRQEDFDGAYEYFGPVAISCLLSDNWNVYVNGNVLYISADDMKSTSYQLGIFDMNGKNIYSKNITPTAKSIHQTTDLEMLNAGIYIVSIRSNDEVNTYKIVIAK